MEGKQIAESCRKDFSRGTKLLLHHILENKPILFTKFGDGEYIYMNNLNGGGPEMPRKDDELRQRLIDAYRYLSKQKNVLIGSWWHAYVVDYLISISSSTNWVCYHTLILDRDTTGSIHNGDILDLCMAVKNSTRKKIFVSNPLLVKATILLDIKHHVKVDIFQWYWPQYQEVIKKIEAIVLEDEEIMIITCAGLVSKVLLAELHQKYPNGIFLDFGCAFDYLCTKKDSRGFGDHNYNDLIEYFKSIIPTNWDDPCYDWIYNEAQNKLGLHLR